MKPEPSIDADKLLNVADWLLSTATVPEARRAVMDVLSREKPDRQVHRVAPFSRAEMVEAMAFLIRAGFIEEL